jgi:hypothetical protein
MLILKMSTAKFAITLERFQQVKQLKPESDLTGIHYVCMYDTWKMNVF